MEKKPQTKQAISKKKEKKQFQISKKESPQKKNSHPGLKKPQKRPPSSQAHLHPLKELTKVVVGLGDGGGGTTVVEVSGAIVVCEGGRTVFVASGGRYEETVEDGNDGS